MEPLLVDIQECLTNIARDLFKGGRRRATQKVNDAFEELAFRHAGRAGLAFGKHDKAHDLSQNQDSDKRILVCREAGRIHDDRDVQGRFLLDHCWLVYYNAKASGDYLGRLAGCELIMESEWNFDSDNPNREFEFLYDFRKLLITGARVKVFIFQSQNTSEQEETFSKLLGEIKSYGTSGYAVGTYLLCGWHSNAFHYVTVSG